MRYARAVKHRPRIEVPSARDDELAVRSLVATSVACLAAGLLLAFAAADERGDTHASNAPDQHERAPSASVGAEEPLPPAPPAADPQPAITMPGPPVATFDAGPALAATPAAPEPEREPERAPESPAPGAGAVAEVPMTPEPMTPEPVAPAPDVPPRKLKVKPGVVAYLRCDGLAQRRGPVPCPRDRELETRMREIIETLPNCREAHAISRGNFEVRLEHIATGAVRDLMVKAPNEAADRAVRACAGAALRKTRTALKPTRMIVSMRFKAR